MLSNDAKEEIRDFADRITPKNWNIILHPLDAQFKPRVFNLFISIGDENEEMPEDQRVEYGHVDEENRPCPGGVTGGVLFSDLRERGFEEGGKVSQAVIQIWPYRGDWRLRLVREFALLTAYRRKALGLKAHKGEETVIVRPEFPDEKLKDRSFSKAYSLFSKRSEEAFGHKMPSLKI
ncbi:MAG: hypothetical protein JRJ86_19130 [Deltaproteobacteria bacterium]|nr:hypothetical protein [Deltaproteobacteria bacterium]MBW2120200.1 hypothetical protein [Deltaproteobacteria bacterium]MBW2345341.1 hypothetical protein [Deltaproteobacteria bacterium]